MLDLQSILKTPLLITQSCLWIKCIVHVCWVELSCTPVTLLKIPQNNASLIFTLVQGIFHLSPRTEVLRVFRCGYVGGQCCGPPRPVHRPGKRYILTAQLKLGETLPCCKYKHNRFTKSTLSNRLVHSCAPKEALMLVSTVP